MAGLFGSIAAVGASSAGLSSFWLRCLRRRRQRNTTPTITARPTTPPTTPPAIAPVFDLDVDLLAGVGVSVAGINLDAVRGDAEAVVAK